MTCSGPWHADVLGPPYNSLPEVSDEGYSEPVPGDRLVSGLGYGAAPRWVFLGRYRLGRPGGGYRYVTGNRGKWATLSLFSDGLRLAAGPVTFKASVPRWEARYDELRQVSAVGTFPARGVRFYVGPAGHDVMIFYTWERRGLLRALQTLGVPVNFAPVRFFYARLRRGPSSGS